MFRHSTWFLLVSIFMLSSSLHSQEVTRIILEQADFFKFDKALNPDVQRIIGNVIFSHDSAYLYCDSAYFNQNLNDVTAFGNVHIMISDTLNIYGDSLKYNGNTRIAHLLGNARLVDNQTVLTSDTIIYDRNTRVARYDYWGKIVNGKNVLVSHFGYYYTDLKEFFFKEKVFLRNPDFTIHSDTMRYNTVTEVAFFFGPSTIVGKEDSIYTENGWYNTRTDEARFRKNAEIYHESQVLTGDSMYYDRRTGFGQAFQNAMLRDTVERTLLMGNYGEVLREKGYVFMTKEAVAGMVDKLDTLFVHADTIFGFFDSANNINLVKSYYKVKFFRKDLQGICDSMVYHGSDSTMFLYKEPVMWSEENQLTADTMSLTIRNGKMDSLVLYGSAFIISRDDTSTYNQIKGKNMIGYFLDNQLYKIKVLGNAETIYFVREEDKSMIGINKVVSSDMLIYLEDNKVKSITYIGSPSGTIYPEKEVSPYDLKLRDFKWLESQRPLTKQDIFLP
jgi:lipopolysaccharide export system protein LptA